MAIAFPATVAVFPDWVTTAAALSQFATRGAGDQNGDFTAAPLPPGKYRVLATTQSVRWNVPEDLDRLMLVLSRGQKVEVGSKAAAQTSVEAIRVY
jgi:hypothetical protein